LDEILGAKNIVAAKEPAFFTAFFL